MTDTKTFMETFQWASFIECHLLWELYLHEFACFRGKIFNFSHYVGDIQLMEFTSFMHNQINWKETHDTVTTNLKGMPLYIRNKLGIVGEVLRAYNRVLQFLEAGYKVMENINKFLEHCSIRISLMRQGALDRSKLGWEVFDKKLKNEDPYYF